MGIISIENSNDSDHFPSLFLRLLDRRYQIQFYSITSTSSAGTASTVSTVSISTTSSTVATDHFHTRSRSDSEEQS